MKVRTFLALVLLLCVNAFAEVSLKNGNYYVSFTDLKLEGGFELEVRRVYNSSTDFAGMFGYGWGTEFESGLRVDPDGSLLITEFGGGMENRFLPKNYGGERAKEIAGKLVEATRKVGGISNAQGEAAYRERVMLDPTFRSQEWKKFSDRGIIPKIQVKEGQQFVSTLSEYQYITRLKGGYVLVTESGKIRKFDERGRLVQISEKSGPFVNLTYDSAGRIGLIVDHLRRKLVFSYNNKDRLIKVSGESGKSTEYKYDDRGLLIYSKDSAGIEHGYSYSKDRFALLQEIKYLKSKGLQKIAYFGPDQGLNVKSVEMPDGSKYEYDYVIDKKNPDYYAASVLIKDSKGNKISNSKYEYFSKRRVDGEKVTVKMVEMVDGKKTVTEYHETLGYPVKVDENGSVTLMEYDTKGRMTKKVTPFETAIMVYDMKVGKLKRIERKPASGKSSWSEFTYDPKNSQLIGARNSDNQAVKIVYDQKLRPKVIVDHKKHALTFVYNELGKPIEIQNGKAGRLKFTYKNSGEVDKVDNIGGAVVAQEISEVIQTFYDLVRPAGVTISF